MVLLDGPNVVLPFNPPVDPKLPPYRYTLPAGIPAYSRQRDGYHFPGTRPGAAGYLGMRE
jgi:hypothetical protein